MMRTFKIVALMSVILLGSTSQMSAQGFLSKIKGLLGGGTKTEQTTTTTQSTSAQSATDNTSSGNSSSTMDISSALGGLGAIGDILNNVIGGGTINEQDIVGTWNYREPACAFTSQNLLAQAGGTVASEKVEEKMLPLFGKIGMSSSNTSFTFNEDKTFKATVSGKSFSGTYAYDPSTSKINLKGSLFTAPCYVTKSGNNLNLLFDTSKLLSLFQTVAKYTNNSTLQSISSLSENFDGMRLGIGYQK